MSLEFTIRVKATDVTGKPQEHLYIADATDRYDAFNIIHNDLKNKGYRTITDFQIEHKRELKETR